MSDWFSAPRPAASANIVPLATLVDAFAACWDSRTAYAGAVRPGNPAWGQCYPTSRVVQWFRPELEIAKGEVWTGTSTEHHFWNVRGAGDDGEWIDLTWQQFPTGSTVRQFVILDRHALGDRPATQERCALLLSRVLAWLECQT